MIFVTVGAQLPFDRLVSAMDAWAGAAPGRDVFAQIGATGYEPRHLEWTRSLTPADFRARMDSAELIVAHAGMGTILTALELGRPIVVMPRRGDLRETRNDHQLATARRFESMRRVTVVDDEQRLALRLDALEAVAAADPIPPHASLQLLDALRRFVAGEIA